MKLKDMLKVFIKHSAGNYVLDAAAINSLVLEIKNA